MVVSHRPLALVLALALGIETAAIAGTAPGDSTQRFSIAISGGASKGAYEAGLNWAILRFAALAGVVDPATGGLARRYEAASFAGASAGSINSLLSGLTWCLRPESEGGLANSVSENMFRELWLKPDVNRMLPEIESSGVYLPDDALLSRRDLVEAARDLQKKWHQPAFRPGCKVPLGVTVTRVKPALLQVGEVPVQNQRFYIPFELRVDESGTVGFHFDPADYPQLNDPAMILIPTRVGAPHFSIADEQIEEAVFASSAFPVAFGRKKLHYCRLSSITADARSVDKTNVSRVDSDALACPQGYELASAEFADGGLFDNLPIGIARLLAESGSVVSTMPVTYVYMDPNRRRFAAPAAEDACSGAVVNIACQTMEYSFASESELLLGALGTARRYELYRELTSPAWQHNLSELSYRLANRIEQSDAGGTCDDQLPYYSAPAKCAQAVRSAARFLELAYDFKTSPITVPFSPEKLRAAGVVTNCREPAGNDDGVLAECQVDIARFREGLAKAVTALAERYKFSNGKMHRRLSLSSASPRADRIIRVTSLGGPITGSLLESFGAFLDLKFREYDYYAGIYDAVVAGVDIRCNLQYSYSAGGRYEQCRDKLAEALHRQLLGDDARGKYVFGLLARAEFGATRAGVLRLPAQQSLRTNSDGIGRYAAAKPDHGQPGSLVPRTGEPHDQPSDSAGTERPAHSRRSRPATELQRSGHHRGCGKRVLHTANDDLSASGVRIFSLHRTEELVVAQPDSL